jgi:hypothetical protein
MPFERQYSWQPPVARRVRRCSRSQPGGPAWTQPSVTKTSIVCSSTVAQPSVPWREFLSGDRRAVRDRLLGERHELLMLPGSLGGDCLVLAGQLRLCLPYLACVLVSVLTMLSSSLR